MAEKQPKKGFLGTLENLLELVNSFKGLLTLGAALGLVGSGGWAIGARADSARIDSLAVEVDSVKARQSRQERKQEIMFAAQIQADTALKAVLEGQAADKRKESQARHEADRLFNDITGGTP